MQEFALSHVRGGTEPAIRAETIGLAFAKAATHFAEREALIVRHQDIRWTYRTLSQQVGRCAVGLLKLGLRPGDRVGIWAPNCAEWLVAQLATAQLGMILVNINPAYRVAELEFCLRKVGCKALISVERFRKSDHHAMITSLLPELTRAEGRAISSQVLPELKYVIYIGGGRPAGVRTFADICDSGETGSLAAHEPSVTWRDAVNIQFTSGTTGAPKGATLSHLNILNNAYFTGEGLKLCEADRLCIPVPLYHCFGMVMGNLAAITHGAAMIYPSEAFDPTETLAAVADEGATVLYGVPTMFSAELECPQFAQFDLRSLRTGVMAGAPCPIDLMRRVIQDMHMPDIAICYGMTETSPVSFQTALDDSVERRVGTVGKIQPHLEAKIVDHAGQCVGIDTDGEILVRGYSVMMGYWDEPERTREAIDADGWMHTGDLGRIDGEGYCRITGRIKDIIIRGGENIFPVEVENFLYRHPAVQAAQVFGIPDELYGEEVCAWVQLKAGASATAQDIREFCREQIAHYKIPRHVRLVDGFPLTVTGKAQKFIMREHMKRELLASSQTTASY